MKFTNVLSDAAALDELGARLAQARLAKGLTQEALAQNAGVSKSTVERLESGGSTQLGNLVRCLRALGRLDSLEVLFPEAAPTPMDFLERQGKQRQRARPKSAPNAAKSWTWGEG